MNTDIKSFEIEDRVVQAVRNFESGYNCAQSVFLAYSDVIGLDFELAKNMSVSFGAGVGRMREICGTVSAMAMLAGFIYPVSDPNDLDARTINYAMIQKMADIFKNENQTIICRELLPETETDTNPTPSVRDEEYYKRRPCSKYIADSARIAGKMLKNEL